MPKATSGYDRIISYLQEHWGDREVRNFVREMDNFFNVLVKHTEILQKTSRQKNLYRGPINKLTILTYRVRPKAQQIDLINIRGARQKPLKA
jgi:plasmid stabilization system protein ParE